MIARVLMSWFPTLVLVLIAVSNVSLAAENSAKSKIIRYARFQAGDEIAYGIVEGDSVRQIDGDLFGKFEPTDKTHKLADVKLLVPAEPSKVLAAARNYRSHGASGESLKCPQMFFKPPSCLIADGEKIVIPKSATNIHYEAELVIVIGKRAKKVSKEKALDYVLGVTCGNDVSNRDWQGKDIQWWRAKGFDTFGPCGPYIVRGLDYDNLLVQLRLNGEVKQKEGTDHMVFSVPEIVSFVSRHCTLEPGDLIYTGTSGQTGNIKPGDVAEVEIEGVGILTNKAVAEK